MAKKKALLNNSKTRRSNNPLAEEERALLKQHERLKLQIELVPGSCFWSNVRSNVSDSQWDRIRKPIYQKANFLCEICGGKGTKHPVECHEIWIYDEESMTQRLSHFQAICPLCHEVKHMGLAGIMENGERAFNRFKQMNGLDEATANKMKDAVFRQWRLRTLQQWKLDIEHLRVWGIDPATLKERHKISRPK